MPFPWKKNKVSRFSRFVADLQSPKRGGSLVVETGFPTSLVDLFVKNRDRLKRQSKKKSKHQLQHSPAEISGSVIATAAVRPVANPSGFKKSNLRNEVKKEFVVPKKCDSVVVDTTSSDERNIVLAILKMFLVVLVALSTKRLAVGITMSAFLLLLLEYVGARAFRFFKPCSKSKTMINAFLCKVKFLPLVRSKRENFEQDSGKTDSSDNWRKSSVGEILVLESNIDGIEEILETDSVNGDEEKDRVVEESVQRICDILASEEKISKGAKFRAKIVRKLVPKKLRGGKKGKKNKKETESSSSEVSSCTDRGDEISDVGVITIGSTESGVRSQTDSVEIKSKGNSGFLILFLVVLSGLAGGRVVALLLTVGWCLVLKLVGNLRRPVVSISG